jgi:hypothetical protein
MLIVALMIVTNVQDCQYKFSNYDGNQIYTPIDCIYNYHVNEASCRDEALHLCMHDYLGTSSPPSPPPPSPPPPSPPPPSPPPSPPSPPPPPPINDHRITASETNGYVDYIARGWVKNYDNKQIRILHGGCCQGSAAGLDIYNSFSTGSCYKAYIKITKSGTQAPHNIRFQC